MRVRLLILSLLALNGCVVPWPSRTPIAPAVRGHVTDAHTGVAVVGAVVEHRFDDQIRRTSTTRDDGTFAVKGLSQQHWGYFFGVALNYPLPYWRVVPGQRVTTEVRVTHPDYMSHVTSLQFGRGGGEPDDKEVTPLLDHRDLLIQIVPVEPDWPTATIGSDVTPR